MIGAFVSLCLFVVGLAGYTIVYGLQPSLSDYYYKGQWWSVWLAVVTMLALPWWIDCHEDVGWLAALAGMGLLFVAGAPAFKGHERAVHFGGASVAGVATVVWGLAVCWPLTAAVLTVTGLLCLAWREYWLLMLEVGAFVGAYGVMLVG